MAKLSYRYYWMNNASTTLTAQLESGVTTVAVADGTVFGSPSLTYQIYLTFDDGVNREIVRCTSRSGNNLTVVRGQELTSGTQVWPVDQVIENRLTEEQLDDLQPGEGYVGTIAIGLNSDTDAVDAIAIGTDADSAVGVAGNGSHTGQIAIGSGAETSWNGSIAIGLGAKANPVSSSNTSSIAIGEGAQSLGNSSVHIGEGNDSSTGITDAAYAITIGSFSTNDGDNSILIGYSSDVEAAGDESICIGHNTLTESAETIAIGMSSRATGNSGMAVGPSTVTLDSGLSVGNLTRAVGYNTTAIGREVVGYHVGTIAEPPAVCPREDGTWSLAGDCSHLISRPVTVTFPPMDLGVPQTWTTASTYIDQEVVVDPTPTGTEQHYLVIGATATDPATHSYYDGDAFTTNDSTEGSEPSWSGTQGGKANATAANSSWVMIDPETGVELDVTRYFNSSIRFRFVPTRIGFYCFEITGTHTQKPLFDFGNETSDTAYSSAEAIDLITADDQMQWWDIAADDSMVPACENLKITLNTAGDGALFMGKFVVEGIVMALRG